MIEVKGLTRVYKTKKGIEVKALDGVNLSIGETGMVFILGKSGSGKSTLLNMLGGLDRYDSGEIIIKGKSSKDFRQSEFDSYRNTYVGFIFQEYNILNDFTVAQNIALAMELQGKKATNESLNALLKTVDLDGLGIRKPNELSGGQKQRVAIARALIKEPEIIMADEPTGALDSNTGKQVFDTLKKLSKEKLVLVVSHDREFAEIYGDRVIELADGKIISDITKFKEGDVGENAGVRVFDDKIIHITKGYTLTEEDFKLIKNYIEKNSVDTVISLDEKTNDDIKTQAHIEDNGVKCDFKPTDKVNTKEYKAGDFKLIKSKLPIRNAIKMGASSLRAKPIRLAFTILLSFIAFALFGITATAASYNKTNTTVNSLRDSNNSYYNIIKAVQRQESNYSYLDTSSMSLLTADIDAIQLEYPNAKVLPVITSPTRYNSDLPFVNIKGFSKYDGSYSIKKYYSLGAKGIVEFDNENEFKALIGNCNFYGSFPKDNNEIVITKYIADQIVLFGLVSETNETQTFLNINEIVSRQPKVKITDNGVYCKIVGVVDTAFDMSKFERIKPDITDLNKEMVNDTSSYMLENDLHNRIKMEIHGLCFAKTGFAENSINIVKERYNIDYSSTLKMGNYIMQPEGQIVNNFFNSIITINGENIDVADIEINGKNIFYFDANKTSISGNEVIISAEGLNFYNNVPFLNMVDINPSNIVYTKAMEYAEAYSNKQELIDFLQTHYVDGDVNLNEYSVSGEFAKYYQTGYNVTYNETKYDDFSFVQFKDKTIESFFKDVYETNIGLVIEQYRAFAAENPYDKVIISRNETVEEHTIVGFFFSSAYYSAIGLSNDSIQKYEDCLDVSSCYGRLLVLDNNKQYLNDVVKNHYTVTDTAFEGKSKELLYLYTSISETVSSIDGFITPLLKVLFYVGLFFAAFASLLMMNFITTSISYKKREIGILRAVGARGADVFGIFFSESFIIAIINFVLASIASFVVTIILNGVIRNQYNLAVTLLSFGPLQIALVFGISVLIAFIASLFPVVKIAKKKPIDAIANR